jgi:hypothetical protein
MSLAGTNLIDEQPGLRARQRNIRSRCATRGRPTLNQVHGPNARQNLALRLIVILILKTKS